MQLFLFSCDYDLNGFSCIDGVGGPPSHPLIHRSVGLPQGGKVFRTSRKSVGIELVGNFSCIGQQCDRVANHVSCHLEKKSFDSDSYLYRVSVGSRSRSCLSVIYI